MKKIIKLFDPSVDSEEEEAIKQTLKSHFWSSGSGNGKVSIFENKFKKYCNSDECVAVNSGSAALHLALSTINLKNKEVILPSFTFVSTAHAIILNGGKPIFADIDPTTLCIENNEIERKITRNTAAVIPVHFGGLPADIDKISEICSKNNIKIIEDAAHATGSTLNGKRIGSHSFAVCHSFNPTKNLVMPNGGAITLNGKNSKTIKELLKAKRWCGIFNRKGSKYDVKEMGWNYFMNEFSANIGLVQLNKINRLITKRKNIAKRYSKEINIKNKIPFDKNCSYHLFWIRVKNRKNFMKEMLQQNIETGIHFQPIHSMSMYKIKKHLPITEKISFEIVSLPMHPNLSDNEISKVIKFTNKFSKEN